MKFSYQNNFTFYLLSECNCLLVAHFQDNVFLQLINLFYISKGFWMALRKTEVNLRRLLATAPQQENQAKLIHVHPQLF